MEESGHEELQWQRQHSQQSQQSQHSGTATPREHDVVSRRRSSSLTAVLPQSGRAGSKLSNGSALVSSESRTRKLSDEEMLERRKASVKLFREAYAVNRSSRSTEDMEALLSDMKRLPSLNSSMSRCSTASGSESGRRRCRGPAPEQAAAHGLTLQQEAAARAEAKDVRATGTEPDPPKVEDTPSKAASPRRSFLQQFGFGCSPKEQEPRRVKSPPPEVLPQRKSSNFVGISVGNNDLLERLARQKKLKNSVNVIQACSAFREAGAAAAR